ncbi:MAG: hypothetical protein ACE5F1_09930, partial [Planctomycetota bacterium]
GSTRRTGRILALAEHPDGTTFVAAEGGLFSVSPEVEDLDPVELSGEAPAGKPVGIRAGRNKRLWVATDEAFGCVDTTQFFGRSFAASDGLPEGPYLGLGSDESGALLLGTSRGVYRYLPDQGPPPEFEILEVSELPGGDEEYLPDMVYDLYSTGRVRLRLQGIAEGGARYLYRHRERPHWHRLDARSPVISCLGPGRHTLEIVALDRDLRRSPPRSIRVRVPYPFVLSKAFLFPTALGLALAIFFGFVWMAHHSRGGVRTYARAGLSAFLMLVLVLQVLAGLFAGGRAWPFVGFPMHSEKYGEGSQIEEPLLVGVLADGSRIPVEPRDGGLGSRGTWQALVPLLYDGAGLRRQFLDAYNARHPERPLAGFIVQVRRHRLTKRGPVAVAPIVYRVHPEELSGDGR